MDIIKALKTQVQTLSEEVANLKTWSHKTESLSVNALSEDEIIAEVEERQQKANNVIVYNIPESAQKSNDDKIKDDYGRCVTLITKICPNVTFVSCKRLGKINENRSRPIQLRFNSSDVAASILKNYKVKDSVYLNRDLTF